ncbi:MAG TPA: flagellar brake protein [Acidiferrobacteraceae bacterium]|nr:flagellar brake protein [Acidiferrobacteraceae bacterium]
MPTPSPAELLKDPASIAQILTRLQINRNLVALSLPKGNGRYLSTVIEVNLEQRFLLLDELSSAAAHRRMLSEKRFHFQATVDGIKIDFNGAIDYFSKDNVGAFYRVPFPTKMQYMQQRAHYRARITIADPISVALSRSELASSKIEGGLHDISVGGLGVHFKKQLEKPIKSGDFFPGCMITLLNATTIACSFEARFVKPEKDKSLRVGGRFVDIDTIQQRHIERFVAEMDREFLRRLARNR